MDRVEKICFSLLVVNLALLAVILIQKDFFKDGWIMAILWMTSTTLLMTRKQRKGKNIALLAETAVIMYLSSILCCISVLVVDLIASQIFLVIGNLFASVLLFLVNISGLDTLCQMTSLVNQTVLFRSKICFAVLFSAFTITNSLASFPTIIQNRSFAMVYILYHIDYHRPIRLFVGRMEY